MKFQYKKTNLNQLDIFNWNHLNLIILYIQVHKMQSYEHKY